MIGTGQSRRADSIELRALPIRKPYKKTLPAPVWAQCRAGGKFWNLLDRNRPRLGDWIPNEKFTYELNGEVLNLSTHHGGNVNAIVILAFLPSYDRCQRPLISLGRIR